MWHSCLYPQPNYTGTRYSIFFTQRSTSRDFNQSLLDAFHFCWLSSYTHVCVWLYISYHQLGYCFAVNWSAGNYRQHCAKCVQVSSFRSVGRQFWGFSPHRGYTQFHPYRCIGGLCHENGKFYEIFTKFRNINFSHWLILCTIVSSFMTGCVLKFEEIRSRVSAVTGVYIGVQLPPNTQSP